jgi:hypothetical protein
MITKDNQKQLSAIVLNIANPALMIYGAVEDTPHIGGGELAVTCAVILGLFAVMILLAIFVPSLLGFKKDSRGIIRLMLVFSNIGFMGMPLVQSLYGSEAVIYVVLFLIPFNVLFYTYGIFVISKEKGGKGSLKQMLNVGVIAGIITVIIYFANIKLPMVITESLSMLSKLTGPLSMMIIGSSLMDLDYKKIFKNVSLLVFTVVKMIVLPVAILFVLKRIITNEMLLNVCLVMLSVPVGSMCAMLVREKREDKYELSAMGVALTTVVSVATIPLVSLITGIG